MRSTTYNKLEQLYQKTRGYVSTQELMQEGFTNRQIGLLINEKYLEKVCHGFYWLMRCEYEKPFDYKCIEVCLSNPRAVISLESACYYQRIIRTEPEVLTVATERTDRSTMKMKFPVERHYFSGNNFKVGIERIQTAYGVYNIYNAERSLCDILRLERKDSDNKAVIEIYDSLKARKEQAERLLEYARLFGIKGL